MRKIVILLFSLIYFVLGVRLSMAQTLRATIVQTPTPSQEVTPILIPIRDLTQKNVETIGPLEVLLAQQELGPVWPANPLKYAIRNSVASGVPTNTLVLLLLLPVVATIIAAFRHLVGLRGFGIFLPAVLSVVFVATGPVVGIGLFLIIVLFSIVPRLILRSLKIKLQYLPRMALILLFVVFGVMLVLFLAPVINRPDLANVSIFPVLILILLAEDFNKVQIGKNVKIAINLTTETLILALVSYIFLTLTLLQEFALLNPEMLIVAVALVDLLLGKYVGLRFIELWRFRKLLAG